MTFGKWFKYNHLFGWSYQGYQCIVWDIFASAEGNFVLASVTSIIRKLTNLLYPFLHSCFKYAPPTPTAAQRHSAWYPCVNDGRSCGRSTHHHQLPTGTVDVSGAREWAGATRNGSANYTATTTLPAAVSTPSTIHKTGKRWVILSASILLKGHYTGNI